MEAVLKKCHFNVVVNGFITLLRTQMLTRCLSATVVIPTVYKSMHFSYPMRIILKLKLSHGLLLTGGGYILGY